MIDSATQFGPTNDAADLAEWKRRAADELERLRRANEECERLRGRLDSAEQQVKVLQQRLAPPASCPRGWHDDSPVVADADGKPWNLDNVTWVGLLWSVGCIVGGAAIALLIAWAGGWIRI